MATRMIEKTEKSHPAQTAQTLSTVPARQVAGIVLLAAGWGWAMGNFSPPDASLVNELFHTIPVLLVLILSLGFFRAALDGTRTHGGWARIGLNIFAAISSLGFIAGTILGVINTNPDAYGIQTVADRVPAAIIILGGLVWLTTLVHER
ncbi:MAG: hypothetical protein ACRDHP_04835 [Ktedonobacterales bacterium]